MDKAERGILRSWGVKYPQRGENGNGRGNIRKQTRDNSISLWRGRHGKALCFSRISSKVVY